jgi:hypothetical protein
MDNDSLICQNVLQVWELLARMFVTLSFLEERSFNMVENHAQNLLKHI